jgi:hypothetical protein
VSQRFNNDNILLEQACANIKKQTFVHFHCKNMVILSKFLDFVMFEAKDLAHINAKLKIFITLINYHFCPIFHAENMLSKFTHFKGPILTLLGPTSLLEKIVLLISHVQFTFISIMKFYSDGQSDPKKKVN